MPQTLSLIPANVPIVDIDGPSPGSITLFFRQWIQKLIDNTPNNSLITTPLLLTNQNAAIVTTNAYAVLVDGLYEISYYIRKTTADGVSSSLTVTLGWTESGVPLTETQAAIAADATTAEQSVSKLVHVDANTALTFAIAYASNTPGQMKYRVDVCVRRLS